MATCSGAVQNLALFTCLAEIWSPGLAQIVTPSAGPSPSGGQESDKRHISLEGRVLSQTTGRPLPQASVRLKRVAHPAVGVAMVEEAALSTLSDAGGKFTFEDVEPGDYLLSAERTGYIRRKYGASVRNSGGTILRLNDGTSPKDVSLKLAPQAILAGRVIDAEGEPIPSASVQVLRAGYVRGIRQLLPAGLATTNPDGSYMIGDLAPGRYFVKASPSPILVIPGMNDRAAVKSGQKAPVATYFPNAMEAASATPIDVVAGADMQGIEIRLQRSPVFRIRGKAIDLVSGHPAQNMIVVLMSADISDANALLDSAKTLVRNDLGSFEFDQVPPGDYIVQPLPGVTAVAPPTTGEVDPAQPLVGRQTVTVSDRDLDDIVLELNPGMEVRGRIAVEDQDLQQSGEAVGDPPQRSQSKSASIDQAAPRKSLSLRCSLSLQPAEGLARSGVSTNSGEDGTFVFRGIAPGRFRLRVTELADALYVKSVRFNGEEATGKVLDFGGGPAGSMDLLLAPAATLTGVVRNSRDAAAPGAMVSLWDKVDRGASAEPARVVNSDQNGVFRFGSLAPGEYLIVGWEDVDPGLAVNAAFCARFEKQATSIQIGASLRLTAEVKLVASDASGAETEKLQ